MAETTAHLHTRRLLAAALSATLVAAGIPALMAAPSAYADDTAATTTAASNTTTLQDGTYTANVGFTCGFEMNVPGMTMTHNMSSIMPSNSKATIVVKNGVATATVNFGTGSYIMNGNDTHAKVYLSDSYTPRNSTEKVNVPVGVSTTQAKYGSDAYQKAAYKKNADGAITSLSFPVSANTSNYYLRAAINGGGQMAFPYTTTQGSTFYPAISIDWSTLTASGSRATTLAAGTYTVPAKLMNAGNTKVESMAASAIKGGQATVTVAKNGTATVNVKISPVTVGKTTAYATDFKTYASDTSSKTTDAKVVSKVKGTDYPSEISFALPPAAASQGGVYLNMTVGIMGYSPNAFLQLDFAKAKKAAPAKKVTSATVNSTTASAAAVKKAIGKNGKTVSNVTLGSKVKKVSKKAFAKYKNVKTVTVKTKKLTKKSVKGSLTGSKVTTVKVNVGSKKQNAKYVKSYKKIFTKANAGKSVKVK